MKRLVLAALGVLFICSAAHAEYLVLRSGQRIAVTGYQLVDGKYKLQMKGGSAQILADDVVTIEPEDTFEAIPPQPAEKAPYHELIAATAAKYRMDADLITSVIAVESNFNPKAVSRKNARGLMQLLPETAALFGTRDIFDPKENIEAGTQYLSLLLAQYNNDLILALAAYNAGPQKVRRFGRVPPYGETLSYVRRVKKNYDQRKTSLAPNTPVAQAPAKAAKRKS